MIHRLRDFIQKLQRSERDSDDRLLGDYLDRCDPAAFEAILARHCGMVLGVCRRILPDEHDAEDAFQATFLILIRKARSVSPRSMLGGWLHGVAYHTAIKARPMSLRRRSREKQVVSLPEREAPPSSPSKELAPVIDRELKRQN